MKSDKKSPFGYIFVLISVLLLHIPFYISYHNKMQKFYNAKINSKIISSSDPNGKVVEYYLPNDLEIHVTLTDTINLKVGDSIAKNKLSWKYKVYKKNIEREFEYYKTYEVEN